MNLQMKYFQDKLNHETDAADLAGHFAGKSDEAVVIVIDARNEEAFINEHIPGALNIPHST